MIVIFLIGLLFGWPLMWPTISAEGHRQLRRSVARTRTFISGRSIICGTSWSRAARCAGAIVVYFVAAVLYLTAWAVSWGAGNAVLGDVSEQARWPSNAGLLDRRGAGGGGRLHLHVLLCAMTVIYFLLRYEVDGTEMDEVFVEEQTDQFGLPPVSTDAAGVATIADAAPEDEIADNGADITS